MELVVQRGDATVTIKDTSVILTYYIAIVTRCIRTYFYVFLTKNHF